MVHSVSLIIGRDAAIATFLQQWPGSRAVALSGGWQAIPVDEALQDAIEAKHPGHSRPPELDLSPFGLEAALVAATEAGGGLAYVETDYFGGTGGQSAMAYVDGREAMAPQRARGGGAPINQALRAIGVERSAEADEFDTIGLGERRTMADYEPEGPVRLRGSNVETTAEPETAFVPGWQVGLAIAVVIAIGVFIAAAG